MLETSLRVNSAMTDELDYKGFMRRREKEKQNKGVYILMIEKTNPYNTCPVDGRRIANV